MNAINRIILVGNGFDLAHGLATRYADFINWYWKQWENRLLRSAQKIEDDGLFSFRLKDNVGLASWYMVWQWHYRIPLLLSNDLKKYDIINRVKNDTNVCDYKSYSTFFDNICKQIEQKKWVDIENEYYDALNKEYFSNPQKLNNEFEIIKLNLIEYLTNIQKTGINEAIINQSLKNKIFAPIKTRDIAISAREHLLKFAAEQYAGIKGFSYATIYHQLEDIDGREKRIQDLENFAEEYGKQIELLGIESVIDENIIPDSLLYPNRLLLLNFNYTHTADLYIPQGKTKEYWFPINHIHGDLKDPGQHYLWLWR